MSLLTIISSFQKSRCKELELELRKSKKTCSTQDQSVTKLEQVIEKLERLKSESDEKHVCIYIMIWLT